MIKFLQLLLLFVPFLSFSQSNFQPGYMVNVQGDTIKGYIDYKERSLNPTDFKFKSANESEAKKYDLTSSLGFGVDRLETYQRFVVDISMSKESLGHLSDGLDTSFIRDTVFLKVLQAGKHVVLYEYNDQVKRRFFILEKNKQIPEELKRNIFSNPENRTAAVNDNKYIKQLYVIKKTLDPHAVVDDQKWMQIKYIKTDLVKVAADINEQEVKKSGLPSTRFFIGAGLTGSKATYSGKHDLAGDGAQSKNSYLPFVNLGVDLFANPAIKKVIYRVELSFMGSNYMITRDVTKTSTLVTERYIIEQKFNQYTAQLTPQVILNLYNTNQMKFFVSAGGSFNFSVYDKNVQTTQYTSSFHGEQTRVVQDPLDLADFYFSPRINTGIVLNNKMEVVAGYHIQSTMTQYLNYSVGVQRISLGINFLLGP